MGDVGFVKALWKEQFERLAQQRLSRTAKGALCLPVHQHDGPGSIDDHQRIRQDVQEWLDIGGRDGYGADEEEAGAL